MSGFEPQKTKKNSLNSIFSADKESRFFADDTSIISNSKYNLIIGLMITAGFALNFLMAFYFQNQILRLPIIGVIIAYFILSLGGVFIVHKATSIFVSGLAFFVMAFGMGLLLTFILAEYEISSVFLAFGITAAITVVMTVLSTLFPQFFLSIGRGLGVSLIIAIIAEVICLFFFRGALGAFDYVIILIFSGYIGYDWAVAQIYQKTARNAIASAADLYIDLVNILIRVLEIVGKNKD